MTLSELCKKDVIQVKNVTKGTEFEAEAVLTDRQRAMVLAGGLLNYTRENN